MQDHLRTNVCVGSAIKKLIDQKIASMAGPVGSTNKGGDSVRAFENPDRSSRSRPAAPARAWASRRSKAGACRSIGQVGRSSPARCA